MRTFRSPHGRPGRRGVGADLRGAEKSYFQARSTRFLPGQRRDVAGWRHSWRGPGRRRCAVHRGVVGDAKRGPARRGHPHRRRPGHRRPLRPVPRRSAGPRRDRRAGDRGLVPRQRPRARPGDFPGPGRLVRHRAAHPALDPAAGTGTRLRRPRGVGRGTGPAVVSPDGFRAQHPALAAFPMSKVCAAVIALSPNAPAVVGTDRTPHVVWLVAPTHALMVTPASGDGRPGRGGITLPPTTRRLLGIGCPRRRAVPDRSRRGLPAPARPAVLTQTA